MSNQQELNVYQLITEEEEVSPEQLTLFASQRVIQAGIWIIRNGYGKTMLLPYTAPSGSYWRCEFHCQGQTSEPFYRYSTGQIFDYLAAHCQTKVRKNISAENLAKKILLNVPTGVKQLCEGPASKDTLNWLDELEKTLEDGFLPVAFDEYSDDEPTWQRIGLLRGNGLPMSPQPGYLPPGQIVMHSIDSIVKAGHSGYTQLSKALQVCINTDSVEKAIIQGSAGSLLCQISRDSSLLYDSKGIALALRALFGSIVAQSLLIFSKETEGSRACVRPISSTPAVDKVNRRAQRMLAAIHELHKAGYQRLRINAGWSADGTEWRCKLIPASYTGADGWRSNWDGPVYRSIQGNCYFDWKDCEADDSRKLATKILERFPELMQECAGQDWAYAGWFSDVLGRAEHGELPVFFKNGFAAENERPTPWPPTAKGGLFVKEQNVTSGFIVSTELNLKDLPAADANEESVTSFCLSCDAYDGFRTLDDCKNIADQIDRGDIREADIDSLRIAAFYWQRIIKWSCYFQPADSKYRIAIHRVINEIRTRLSARS